MPKQSQSSESPSEHNDLGLERIVFFSDAVMAIAITLLAIESGLRFLENRSRRSPRRRNFK